MKKKLKVFFRQSFTEADFDVQTIIQEVLDLIISYSENNKNRLKLDLLTGNKSQNKETFKKNYEEVFKKPFTPKNFRKTRLKLLNNADVFVILRTGMSESTAFEIAYNIYAGKNIPMLFLIWEKAKIKTTLIREMKDIAPVNYFEFGKTEELKPILNDFFVENSKKQIQTVLF